MLEFQVPVVDPQGLASGQAAFTLNGGAVDSMGVLAADQIVVLANPPTVGALSYAASTQTSGDLSATVENHYLAGSATFELGTTTAYELGAQSVTPADGTQDSFLATAALSGLDAGTLYHWRVVFAAQGQGYPSADQTFSTLGVTYSLTTLASAGGSIVAYPSATTFPSGATVTLSAEPDTGAQLQGWLVDGQPAGSANPLTLQMSTNHQVQATFSTAPATGVTTSTSTEATSKGCSSGTDPLSAWALGLALAAVAGARRAC
jgi:hypothetical protein